MADVVKPALAGRDHRDGYEDQISSEWVLVLDEGDTPPDVEMIEDEDYVFLQNDVVQPTAGSGPGGGDLEEFAFRRGLSKLDFKGHLDISGATSPAIACVIPVVYRLYKDAFDTTVVYDGAAGVPGMWYLDSVTGELTLTWPL